MACTIRALFSYFGVRVRDSDLVPTEFLIKCDVISGSPKPGMIVHIPRHNSDIELEILRIEKSQNERPDALEIVLNTGDIQDEEAIKFLHELNIKDEVISITNKRSV